MNADLYIGTKRELRKISLNALYTGNDCQPMGINFGIIKMKFHIRNKKERRELVFKLAVESVREAVKKLYV